MPITVVCEKERFCPLPSGFYKLRLIKIEEGVGSFKNNLVFYFTYEVLAAIKLDVALATTSHLSGRTLRDYVPQTFSVNSKLHRLTRILSGVSVPLGTAFEINTLIDRDCIGRIQQTGSTNKIAEYLTEVEYESLAK
jgi:hypothetical protein